MDDEHYGVEVIWFYDTGMAKKSGFPTLANAQLREPQGKFIKYASLVNEVAESGM